MVSTIVCLHDLTIFLRLFLTLWCHFLFQIVFQPLPLPLRANMCSCMGMCANVCKIAQKCVHTDLYNCADSLRIVIAFYGHTLAGGCFICHGDIMAPSDCSFVQQIKQTNTQTKRYICTVFGNISMLS